MTAIKDTRLPKNQQSASFLRELTNIPLHDLTLWSSSCEAFAEGIADRHYNLPSDAKSYSPTEVRFAYQLGYSQGQILLASAMVDTKQKIRQSGGEVA